MRAFLKNKNLYGAFLIVVGGLTATLSSSLTHSLEPVGMPHIPALQILFLKCLTGLCTLFLILRKNIRSYFYTPILPWHILKGICGIVGNWAFIMALQYLTMATIAALSLTSAILTSLGGYIWFKEKFSWQIGGCIIVGFLGVLVVLNPQQEILSWYALLPLLSALAFSGSSLMVKVLCTKDRSETILLYLLITMGLLSAPFALYTWVPLSWVQLIKIIGVGITYTLTQLLLIKAYTHGSASFIAPFKFVRFPLNVLAEILFFFRWPKFHEWFGGAIIALSALYLVWWEKYKRKKAKE